MSAFENWVCVDKFRLNEESQLPEKYTKAIYVAVKALIPVDEDDYEEAVEIYEEDFDDELPYETRDDFSLEYILHPLTFELIGSENHQLRIHIIDAGELNELVSVYGGEYGYVVQGETLFALNEQGDISLLQTPVDLPKHTADVLSQFIRHGSKGSTYADVKDA